MRHLFTKINDGELLINYVIIKVAMIMDKDVVITEQRVLEIRDTPGNEAELELECLSNSSPAPGVR